MKDSETTAWGGTLDSQFAARLRPTPGLKVTEAVKAASTLNQVQGPGQDTDGDTQASERLPASPLDRVNTRIGNCVAIREQLQVANTRALKELHSTDADYLRLVRVQALLRRAALTQQEVFELLERLHGTGLI